MSSPKGRKAGSAVRALRAWRIGETWSYSYAIHRCSWWFHVASLAKQRIAIVYKGALTLTQKIWWIFSNLYHLFAYLKSYGSWKRAELAQHQQADPEISPEVEEPQVERSERVWRVELPELNPWPLWSWGFWEGKFANLIIHGFMAYLLKWGRCQTAEYPEAVQLALTVQVGSWFDQTASDKPSGDGQAHRTIKGRSKNH